MKLYHSPGACSLAVHIVLEELGVEYEAERVSILDGQNLREPFLAVIPGSLLQFGATSPLKVLPVNLPIPAWPVGVMTLKNRTVTPVVKLFIDCAREVARPLVKAKSAGRHS